MVSAWPGWYAPPRNGAAILALHGASNSREALRPDALMFTRHGFGVLAMDLCGHGESEGQPNYFGWEGGADVEAALRFRSRQPDVATLGALVCHWAVKRCSAAAAQPTLPAIISEGAAHHSMDEFYLLPYHRTPLFDWQSWFTYTTVRVITGIRPHADLRFAGGGRSDAVPVNRRGECRRPRSPTTRLMLRVRPVARTFGRFTAWGTSADLRTTRKTTSGALSHSSQRRCCRPPTDGYRASRCFST